MMGGGGGYVSAHMMSAWPYISLSMLSASLNSVGAICMEVVCVCACMTHCIVYCTSTNNSDSALATIM